MGQRALQGRYVPVNPSKYKGDPTRIYFRSSWERTFMRKLDLNPAVIGWSSEEFSVSYISPKDKRKHRYFPDFSFDVKGSDGRVKTYVVEVKPRAQTQPPPPRKKTQRYLNEVLTYGINQAKWDAARRFCMARGWEFKIVTEEDLYGK